MSYKVQKGDNLTKIAKQHGLSLKELMELNNISKDQANDIKVGQTLKISKNSTKANKPYFGNPVMGQSFLPKQSTITVPLPYDPDYTKEQFLVDNAEKIQQELKRVGYNLGTYGKNKDGIDGKWGKQSQVAWDLAMKDGYVYENGRLVKYNTAKPNLTSKRSSTASYQYSMNPMFGTPINSPVSKETSVSIPNFSEIPVEQLQQIYKEGPGIGNAAGTMLFHVVSPKDFSMPHTDGLKNQVAAAIAYNESLPQNKRERDANGIQTDDEGYQYVGYNTFGILSGQSGNVNNQGTEANAASKVMGGLRYRINEDGSIDVKDRYGFNVVRDFEKINSKGKPKVMSKEEKANDKYAGKPWQGLWHDLTSEHSKIISDNATWRPSTWFDGQGLQDLAENVGTRQGKVRNNSFVFAPGEISKRLSL